MKLLMFSSQILLLALLYQNFPYIRMKTFYKIVPYTMYIIHTSGNTAKLYVARIITKLYCYFVLSHWIVYILFICHAVISNDVGIYAVYVVAVVTTSQARQLTATLSIRTIEWHNSCSHSSIALHLCATLMYLLVLYV